MQKRFLDKDFLHSFLAKFYAPNVGVMIPSIYSGARRHRNNKRCLYMESYSYLFCWYF